MPPRRVLVSRRASSGESRRSAKWVSKPWIRVQPSASTRRRGLVRVEAFHQHHAGAGDRHHQGAVVHAEDMEERQVHEGAVARADAEPIGLVGDVAHEPVGVDDTLRVPGASRGEHDERRRLRVHRRRERVEPLRRDLLAPLQQLRPRDGAGGLLPDARAGPSTITRRRSGQRRSGCGSRGPSRSPGSTSSAISRKPIGPERSASIRVEASDAARAYARSWVRSRTLRGSTTAPSLSAPKKTCSQAGRLGSHRASFSPGMTPAARRPRAARSTSRSNSSNVQRLPSKTSASREPKRRAARDGSAPSATRSNQSPTGRLPLPPPGSRGERTRAAPVGDGKHPVHGRPTASSRPRG